MKSVVYERLLYDIKKSQDKIVGTKEVVKEKVKKEDPPMLDSNKNIINIGDRVIVVGDNSGFGMNQNLEFIRNNECYGVVPDYKNNTYSWYSEKGLSIIFSCLEEPNRKIYMRADHLTVIPKEDWDKYEILNEKAIRIRKDAEEAFHKLEFLPVSKEGWRNRTFSFEDRNVLNTNSNTLMLGKWNVKDNTFQPESIHFKEVCCAMTQIEKDIQVFIPEIWLRYYGYTRLDLIEWLKFLSLCDIGFNYHFMGDVNLHIKYVEKYGWQHKEGFNKHFTFKPLSSSISPGGISGYMGVRLEGNKEHGFETYMRFICLRYMYNSAYWTIPGHAMQIKQSLGNLVTHWEALLMAHLHSNFHGYYCLVAQEHVGKKTMQHRFITNIISEIDQHVNPFQSVEEVKEKVRLNKSMNSSFDYMVNVYDRKEIDNFFSSKNYIGLYRYLKSKKK